MNTIHEVGNVETLDYRPTGTYVAAKVPKAIANRLKRFSLNELHGSATTQEPKEGDEIDWVAIGRGRHSAKGM